MTREVTPDGVVSFDGESYDPAAESGHFTCPRCGWATGWAGGPADDDDFGDDPVREHMDRHADEDSRRVDPDDPTSMALPVVGDTVLLHDGRIGVITNRTGENWCVVFRSERDQVDRDNDYDWVDIDEIAGYPEPSEDSYMVLPARHHRSPSRQAPTSARLFAPGDRVRYVQKLAGGPTPAMDSTGTVTRVVDQGTTSVTAAFGRYVVWVAMDGDPTGPLEAFNTAELVHLDADPADEPVPYKLVDQVPGVPRDPAFVPSTRAASSTSGLDGIRHGQPAPTPDEPAVAAFDRGAAYGTVEGLRQAARVVERHKTRYKDDASAHEALAALDDVVVELLDLAEKGGAA